MAPTATASARRAPAARPRPAAPRRAPLRVFEPVPRRRPPARPAGRPAMWASGLLVVGSLLAVVVGDALLAAGQVRLSAVQRQVVSATAAEKAAQVAVAQKTAPPVVVGAAEGQGMVAPTQVVYLPQVPLGVPLPAPHTVPATAPAIAPSTAPASPTRPLPTPAPRPAPSTSATSSTAPGSTGR